MAKSLYVQNRNRVNAALRAVRRLYRQADSNGEKLERQLDRLILRKTLVSPDQLVPVTNLFRAYATSVSNLERGLADALTIASY